MVKRWVLIATGVACLWGCPLDVNIGECDNARIGRDLRLRCGTGEVAVCTACSAASARRSSASRWAAGSTHRRAPMAT